MPKALKIWCNATFPEAENEKLKASVAPHELIFSKSLAKTVLHAGEADPTLSEADIVFGQPDPKQVIDSPKIKWVHITSAGYTRYDTPEFKNAMKNRGGIFTNSSSVYDLPCAQHVLSMMLAMARQIPETLDDQRVARSWNQEPIRARSFLLDGQFALIFGFGSIAKQLIRYLTPLKVKMTGVRRSPRGDEGIPVVTDSTADDLLASADHVINILPASQETDGYFNADRLKKLKSSAIYYSIGRGSTTDQSALQSLLEQNKIRAAYLDVTTPEPLPPEHPLWKLSNCYITPHSAGGHGDEFNRLVNHFLQNLGLFNEQKELVDQIT